MRVTALILLALGCGEAPAPSAASTSSAAPVTLASAASDAPLSKFDAYRRKAMTSEARVNLRSIVDGAMVYSMSEHVGRTGKVRPPQLPPSVALSPAQSACKDGQPVKHPVDAVPWSGPGWAALAFEPRSAFRYQYAWVTDGKTFTARAIGDLDCDGVTSTFEEFGKVTAGEVQRDPSGPRTVRPLE